MLSFNIGDARARGLHIFATLAYSPGWANGGQPHQAPPVSAADWQRFVRTVVRRYRGQIKHWGMWNETNLSQFFSGSKDDYVHKLLVPGAQAAKAADPALRVALEGVEAEAG